MAFINPNDKKYKCCFGRFSAIRGSLCIAIYGLVFSLFSLIGILYVHFNVVPFDFVTFPTALMTVFCLLISSIQLLLGSLKRNQRLLLLYLLFMAFTTMGFVCLVVMTSICLGVLDSDENWMLSYEQRAEMSYKFEQKSKVKPFLSIILLSSMINVAINFWFFFVVWSAYRLIVDAHYAMRPPKTKSTTEK